MVSNIEYLLNRINLHIPRELLEVGFKPFTDNGMFSIDYAIKEQIILGIVLTDCNLFSGKIKKIILDINWVIDSQVETSTLIGGTYSMYRVPPEVREYQPLTYPLEVSYPTINIYNTGVTNISESKSLYGMANEAIDGYTGIDNCVKPSVTIVGTDIIKLLPPQLTHIDWVVSCIIGYDKSFSNISPGLLKPLSKMCIEATKMWLYNQLIVKIDKGILIGGSELGKFKEILESYSDAEEKYEEYLTQFRGASQFDRETIKEWVGMMI